MCRASRIAVTGWRIQARSNSAGRTVSRWQRTDMHFHLPKPLHGWRALVGEVGIIVIGVLIALGAEHVVETLHERTVANDTRRSIRQELDTGLASLALRQQAEPCIARRLRKVRQIVNEWGQTGRFTTPQWVSQSPRLGVPLARYDAASAAGRL